MKRSSVNLAYALSLYAAISVLCMTVQFFLSEALVFLLYRFSHAAFEAARARQFGPSLCDSAGFAFLTMSNTALQYLLASLMARDLRDNPALFTILTLCSLLSTALFVRLAAHSPFSSYLFAGLPLLFSYLLGGVTGLVQKAEENPFHTLKIHIFKIG